MADMHAMNRYAILTYAGMFSAIWIGDSLFLPLVGGSSSAILGMRVVSLCVYLLFLGIATLLFCTWKRRNALDEPVRELSHRFGPSFLLVTSIVGLALYVAGAYLLLAVPEWGRAGFVLTKFIGAPFSIGAVFILGQLPRPYLMRTIAFGTFGAFLLFAVANYLIVEHGVADTAAAGFCVFLFAASLYWGIRGSRLVGVAPRRAAAPAVAHDAIGRPIRQVLSADFIMGLLMVSLMLGFVRNAITAVSPPDALAVIVLVFVAIIVVGLYRGHFSLSFFFQSGVAFLAAAVLLSPLTVDAYPLSQSLLSWASSAFLEVVAIAMCSWTVHNSRNDFFAAIISRVFMVTGHLLGTVVALVDFSLTSPSAGVTGNSFVLMFAFVVLLLLSYQFPMLRVMFFSASPVDIEDGEEDGAEDHAGADAGDGGTADGGPAGDGGIGQWQDYRRKSCEIVAEVYKLTNRETEVLYLLSQGRTIGYMQEYFVLSPNTLKMHIRHIYQKLDVHSKQEVIDIVDAAQAQ